MASAGAADESPHEHARPYVREELDVRSLHFSMSAIQSRMQVLEPDALTLDYTRTMMGFLVFMPQPASIAMIGLGGGSLAKFCHRHLPRTALVVVEINPHVIALRDTFKVPPDDARFRVVAADGACFVARTQARFDVLMVDAFDARGMPAELGTRRFYDDALDVLKPGGLLVVNLHAGHPHFAVYVDRIRAGFGDEVLRVDDSDGSNSVIFARKGARLQRAPGAPIRRPATLAPAAEQQLRDAFARIERALRARPE